jgi:hypothetical protein
MDSRRSQAEMHHAEQWELQSNPGASCLLGTNNCWAARLATNRWPMEEWLVEGLFRRGGVGMLVGDANVGKSLIALDLALSIASGTRWLRHFDCDVGPVFYVAGEGSDERNDRRAIGAVLGRGDSPRLWWAPKGAGRRMTLYCAQSDPACRAPLLSSAAWWKRVEAHLSALPKGARQALWIFDPLLALCTSVDHEEEVKPVIARCRWLAEESGAYVLLVHHNKKTQKGLSQSDLIRGESMWRNLLDDVLIIRADPEDSHIKHVYTNKLRDGEALGETRPAFMVHQEFSVLPSTEFYSVLDELGRHVTGEEHPGCLYRITLHHREYVEQTPNEITPDEDLPLDPKEQNEPLPGPALTREEQQLLELLRTSEPFPSANAIHEALRAKHPDCSSRNIMTRLLEGLADRQYVRCVRGRRGAKSYRYVLSSVQ